MARSEDAPMEGFLAGVVSVNTQIARWASIKVWRIKI
jgi:hypothetical protein